MKNIQITPELARRIALHAQLLDESAELPAGKEGVTRIIERLGYVQIDTISVIERAHHHTLKTRAADYDTARRAMSRGGATRTDTFEVPAFFY